jgi:ParB family chromosome partitioning protein
MQGKNSDDKGPLSYKGSLSGLKGLLKNRISEGIQHVANSIGGEESVAKEGTRKLPIEELYPCPDQPRQVFDPKALEELSSTMKELGQAQAITVRKTDRGYEIISGERRYRAAKLAGIGHLDCVIKEVESKDARLLSLVENIQRQDLLPIEEAHFLKKILSENSELSLERLAKMIGSHKSTVSEKIQLTEIPESLQKHLYSSGRSFTHRHWRVLSRIKDEALLTQMLGKALEHQMSVADLERSLDAMGIEKSSRSRKKKNAKGAPAQQLPITKSESWKLVEIKNSTAKVKSMTLNKSFLEPDQKEKLISELEDLLSFLRGDEASSTADDA